MMVLRARVRPVWVSATERIIAACVGSDCAPCWALEQFKDGRRSRRAMAGMGAPTQASIMGYNADPLIDLCERMVTEGPRLA